MWNKWVSFLQLGKSLYEYYLVKRDNEPKSDNPSSNYIHIKKRIFFKIYLVSELFRSNLW